MKFSLTIRFIRRCVWLPIVWSGLQLFECAPAMAQAQEEQMDGESNRANRTIRALADQSRAVAEHMKNNGVNVQALLKQQQLVDELKQLIDQLSGGGPSSPSPSQLGGSGAGNDSSSPSNMPGERQLGVDDSAGNIQSVSPAVSNLQLIDRAWGDLPSEIRRRLNTGVAPEFLPKYEAMIRQYYRRMAEQR